ncbi:cell envelope integrity protein TolA [Ningiella sp. W23]|uniref:cell envelope integrity protein TolA n=1 Tax=Ningiella sp. W23 TaxID=3023715 RepID=UPI003756B540
MKENKAMAISAGIHIVLIVLLLVSVDFKPKPTVSFASAAQPIQARFIDAQAIADRQAEQQRQQQAEAQARQQALQRKRDQEQRAAAEREKRRIAKAAEEKKQAEEQREAKERERQRTLEEQRKREQEMQQRLAEEKQKQAEFEKQLADQLAQEQQVLSAANQRRVMSEVEKYQALIQQTIMQNLFDIESFRGKSCRLNVRLSQSGLVIDVRILDGDDALCRASQAAVLRPATLPVSSDPAVFAEIRDLNITVIPEI